MRSIYALLLKIPRLLLNLFSLSSLLWCVVLIGFVIGSINAEKVTSNRALREVWATLSDKCRGFPPLYIGLVLWISLRILFALGIQLQLELLLVLCSVTYVHRNVTRAKKRVYYQIHNLLSESKDPSTILGTNLPEWVTFPSSQRVLWLNESIASLWPSIVLASDKIIRPILENTLAANKPPMVKGFKVREVKLGSIPLVINGIQNHNYGVSETTLDIAVSWGSSMDVCLLVQIPGPDMEVSVRDLSLRGNFRVTLGPHVPTFPCFANAMISILGVPEIDFRLKAAKISLDSIPGLSSFLDNFIRHTLVSLLSYPKGFSYPVIPGYSLNVGFGSGALGIFSIKLEKIDFSIKFLPYRKKKFYIKLGFVGSEKKRRKSVSYIGFDSALQDVFHFTLYDSTPVIRVWVYFDITGKDYCVGTTDIAVGDFMTTDRKTIEHNCTLTREADPTQKKRGSIELKTEFRRLKNADKPRSSPPRNLPSRSVGAEEFHDMVEEGFVPVAPRTRGMPKVSLGGILFISIDSAKDLPNRETFSTSDPYIVLSVDDEIAHSSVVPSNLNPVFKFEAEMMVKNISHSKLKIKIFDKNVNKDAFMCSTEVELARVGCSRDRKLAEEFKLHPQGSFLMSLAFFPFS